MKNCIYTFQGVTLTEAQFFERLFTHPELMNDRSAIAAAAYSSAKESVVSKLNKIWSYGKSDTQQKARKNKEYVGVNEYLRYDKGETNGGRIVPEVDEAAFKSKLTGTLVNGKYITNPEAEEMWQDYQLTREFTNLQGTGFHNIIYAYISAKIKRENNSHLVDKAKASIKEAIEKNDFLKNWIVTQNIDVDTFINHWEKKAKEIADQLYDLYKSQAVFAEMSVFIDKDKSLIFRRNCPSGFNEKKGLNGDIDLLLVDSNGKIHIFDYKISKHSYDEWSEVKHLATNAQLGTYSRMLQSWGINSDDIVEYGIIPLVAKKEDKMSAASTMTLTIDEKALLHGQLHPINVQSNVDRGPLGQTLNHYIYHRANNNNELHRVTGKLYDNIINDIQSALGTNTFLTGRTLHKEKILETIKTKVPVEEKGKTLYPLYDLVLGKTLYHTLEEYEGKNGQPGIIDDYLDRLNNLQNGTARLIHEKLKEAILNNTSIREIRFTENDQINTAIHTIVDSYADKDIEILDIDELIDMSIIPIKVPYRGHYKIDFISVTDKLLTMLHTIGNSQSLLGNFYSADDVKRLQDVEQSTTENIIISQILLSLNRLVQDNMLDELKDEDDNILEIGRVAIVAVTGKDNRVWDSSLHVGHIERIKTNVQQMIHEVNKLAKFEKIKDVWDRRKNGVALKLANDVLSAIDEMMRIVKSDAFLDGSTEKRNIKSIENNLAKLAVSTYSLNQKREALITIIKSLAHINPKYRITDIMHIPQLDRNNMYDNLYFWANCLYLALGTVPTSYDSGIPQWNINLRSLLNLVNRSTRFDNGIKDTGFLGGAEVTSVVNSPDQAVRAIMTEQNKATAACKTLMMHIIKTNERITTDYLKSQGRSGLYQATINGTTKDYERLLVHDANGNIHPDLLMKNPWSKNCDLDELSKSFLKEMIWNINKYRNSEYTPHQRNQTWAQFEKEFPDLAMKIKTADFDSSVFWLPLARSKMLQSMTHSTSSFKERLKNWWDRQREGFDINDTVAGHPVRTSDIRFDEMINMHRITKAEREAILENSKNLYDFSFDLEFLADDVAFNAIREKEFLPVIQHAQSILVFLRLLETQNPAVRYDETMKRIEYVIQTVIKGKPALPKELENAHAVVRTMEKINSMIVLAFRPATFLKELVYGQFVNFSRAWALKGSSNELSIASVVRANAIVWGQEGKKWIKTATGELALDSYTVPRALNQLYSFATQDFIRTVLANTRQRRGPSSSHMYWQNSCPDYFNRMTLFIAKMIEDGSYDAHSIDEETGEMKYDWKKDKRFSKLAAIGLNKNSNDVEYKKQESLYHRMCEEFEQELIDPETGEHVKLKTWNENMNRWEVKDLPKAYTQQQRDSMKEVADTAYGFYDHETRAPFTNKFLGLLFFQFQTFISATWERWTKATPQSKGDNTRQGQFVLLRNNKGELMYIKPVLDPVTQGWTGETELVPESELSADEKARYSIAQTWEGDFVEGIVYSMFHTLGDIMSIPMGKKSWADIKANPRRYMNALLGFHDLLIGILFAALIKFIFTGGSNKMKNMNIAQKVLYRATTDVGPAALFQMSFTPSFVRTWTNMANDACEIAAGGDVDLTKLLKKRVAAFRDWDYEPWM